MARLKKKLFLKIYKYLEKKSTFYPKPPYLIRNAENTGSKIYS